MKGYNTAEGYMGLVSICFLQVNRNTENIWKKCRSRKRRMNTADLSEKIQYGRSAFLIDNYDAYM